MYDDLYSEMIVFITLALLIYALMIPILLNADDKVKHIKWSALGLKNVLKGCEKRIQRESRKKYSYYMMNMYKKSQVQENIFQMLLYGSILLF